MLKAKDKPQTRTPYEVDDYAWIQEQIALLRARRFDELDVAQLIEELDDVASEKLIQLEEDYGRLIWNLLMLRFQPGVEERERGSEALDARFRIGQRERDSRTLVRLAERIVAEEYPHARKIAAIETELPIEAFPETCPFTLEQLRDDEWFPSKR